MISIQILAVLALVALVVSSMGFIRVVWFISIGYGYSISALAVAIALVYGANIGASSWVQLAILLVYGIRLGTYILLRERKESYKRELGDVENRESGVKPPIKFVIWIGVAILYVAMVVPALAPVLTASGIEAPLLAYNSVGASVLTWIGIVIAALGLGTEALADAQKNRYKQKNPSHYCDTGLYRVVRCPNYFGEILVWVGSFIAGLSFFSTWWEWTAAVAGLVCIVLIMMGSTKRLEAKQEERYGDREDFKKFASTVPVLFPILPIYTLKNVKVFLE